MPLRKHYDRPRRSYGPNPNAGERKPASPGPRGGYQPNPAGQGRVSKTPGATANWINPLNSLSAS